MSRAVNGTSSHLYNTYMYDYATMHAFKIINCLYYESSWPFYSRRIRLQNHNAISRLCGRQTSCREIYAIEPGRAPCVCNSSPVHNHSEGEGEGEGERGREGEDESEGEGVGEGESKGEREGWV